MSWDSYIDNVMGHAAGNCDKVCIIDKQTGAPWTSASHANGMNLSATEQSEVVQGVKDDSSFQAKGVTLENVKYQFLRNNDGLCLFKKKDHGAMSIMSSEKAIVIGHTKEGGQQGNTNKGVCTVAEYLKSLNM